MEWQGVKVGDLFKVKEEFRFSLHERQDLEYLLIIDIVPDTIYHKVLHSEKVKSGHKQTITIAQLNKYYQKVG